MNLSLLLQNFLKKYTRTGSILQEQFSVFLKNFLILM